ncbi:MAG: hypothetical protein KatS3mg042_0599 [Rhodothermaceae bacterium]|nr:MAG: hypothetical protein KatS3mg042_0599 [Rhodothermaceae bacterium]
MGKTKKRLEKVYLAARRRYDRVLGWYEWHDHFSQRNNFIFVLGHMRCGSSLLTHILCSHPEVCGYGETHCHYKNICDYYASARRIWDVAGGRRHSVRHFVDKILHAYHIPNLRVLDWDCIRIIVIVRRPDHALSSMLKLGLFSEKVDLAASYYARQLRWLNDVCSELGDDKGKLISLTYSDLVENSNIILRRLADFLSLSSPIYESYQVNKMTGVPGVGDPGPLIKSGKIISDVSRNIDGRVLCVQDRLWSLYHEMVKSWRKNKIYVV